MATAKTTRVHIDGKQKPVRVTKKTLDALKPKEKTYTQSFGGGFTVWVHPAEKKADGTIRCSTSGRPVCRKVCRYVYQVANESGERLTSGKNKGKLKPFLLRRYYLGEYGSGEGQLSLADLLKVYREAAQQTDPVLAEQRQAEWEQLETEQAIQEARSELLKEQGRMRFREAAALFLDTFNGLRGRQPSESTMTAYRNHLNNHLLDITLDGDSQPLGDYPVDDMPVDRIMHYLATKQKTDKRTGKKTGERASVLANRIFATLSTFSTWARKERYMSENPFVGRNKPGGIEQSKDRVLDFNPELREIDDRGEIKRFWNGLDDANPVHRVALQMALLTGQRIGEEILGARWSHFINGKWVIPKEATKNKKDTHKLPVTPALQALLDKLAGYTKPDSKVLEEREKKRQDYLFPQCRVSQNGQVRIIRTGENNTLQPIASTTLSQWLRKALAKEGHPLHQMDKFTTHDLRRTMATHARALGCSKADIGAVLNHSDESITDIYARADDMAAKEKVLTAWQRELSRILTGEKKTAKVVEMKR